MLSIFCPALLSNLAAPANICLMVFTLAVFQPLISPSRRVLQKMLKKNKMK